MSDPRVWVCSQCDRECILIRDEPPVDCLDVGCAWSSCYARWVDANAVQIGPADLLAIAASLSEATTRVMGEAAAYLREEADA